jgi:dTMP kinase
MVLDRFIVLEGLDGAGTTTQLRLAAEKLAADGRPHFCTSEPTDHPLGLLIREVLTHRRSVHPTTLALLFAADRAEHLLAAGGGILNHLERGELVISDRYLFSSLAYQSLDCDFEYVRALNAEFPLPRDVVFLDTPVRESQRRLGGREGLELFDGAEIQDRILENYRRGFALYRDSGLRLHVLDGTLPPAEIFENFWKIIGSVPMH